jgi:hypothetical protein
VITRGADEDVSSNTSFADDGVLQFNVVNGGLYEFELVLVFSEPADSGTPDIKIAWAANTATVFAFNAVTTYTNTGGTGVNSVSNNPATTILASADGSKRIITARGWSNFATADGTFVLRWAQNTSSANATRVHAESRLSYRRVI